MRRLVLFTTFLLLFCVFPLRYGHSAGTWTMVQHVSTGCAGTLSPCSVTVSSTTAGNLLIGVLHATNTNVTLTSISGGTSANSATCNSSDASSGSAAIAWVLNATGGDTSITFTWSSGYSIDTDVLEYHSTNGVSSFDVCNNRDQAGFAANIAGISPGTLSGSNDVILQYAVFSGHCNACPNSALSPSDLLAGNAICGLMNSTNNAAGTYSNASSAAALGAVAFKEASLAGTSPATQSSVIMGGP
jgi:hypothetical protein